MCAEQIWAQDSLRLKTIASLGYKILVIWESEYNEGTWSDKIHHWMRENDKNKGVDVSRSSVNNHSSADVKLGELLGSISADATT